MRTMRTGPHLATILTLLLLYCPATGANEQISSEHGRATDQALPKVGEPQADLAVATLREILHRKELVLSDGPDSTAQNFGLSVQMFGHAKPDGVREITVIRDGNRIFGEFRTGPGARLIAIADNDISVGIDPDNPGGLLAVKGTNVGFRVRADAEDMELFLGIKGKEAKVFFDLRSVIQHLLPKVVAARRDAASGALLLQTDRSRVSVVPTAPGSTVPCAARYLEFDNGQATIRIKILERHDAELRASLPPLTAAWAESLGVPTREAEGKVIGDALADRRLFNIEESADYLRASVQLQRRPMSMKYRFPIEQ